MNNVKRLTDKVEIEAWLRRDAPLHLYSLGDLDDFFWPYTEWYAAMQGDRIEALVLVYSRLNPHILIGLASPGEEIALQDLLTLLSPDLPNRIYAHLSLNVEAAFQSKYHLQSFGHHYKMILATPSLIEEYCTPNVVRLLQDNLPEIQAFYDLCHPGHAFDPLMLETGQYFGIREENRLVSIAGVHVYSQVYRVAAIGNVVTHPDCRNRGLAKAVTATLCQSMQQDVDIIGLNVKVDNAAAIASYQRLGFRVCATYHEMMMETCE